MELRHLRYFLAVAEEQNVTRAALRLHISQPALSRQIQDLEAELGATLFERGPNLVRLSAAGKSFLPDCRLILRRVDDAVEKVRRRKRELVRVGYAASPTTEILSRAMKEFQASYPDSAVVLSDLSSTALLNGLHHNKLDIALTVTVAPGDFKGLTMEHIGAYDIHLAFAKGHRFEKLRKIPLAEIAKEPHVTWTKQEHPEGRAVLRKILSPYVENPPIVMEFDSAQSLVAAVESGEGVAIVFKTLAKVSGKRIILRPVTPALPQLPIGMAYRKSGRSSAVENFIAAVRAARGKATAPRQGIFTV